MLAIFRTLEILALFGALGLPLNYLLLDQVDRAARNRRLSARLLLAPAGGLAVFGCYTALFYGFSLPAAMAVPFLPCLAAALWLPAILQARSRRGRHAAPAALFPGTGWPRATALIAAGTGLAAVLTFSLWPFLQDPERVFWHYAGSDGYMYMRIAEHVASPGTGVMPFVDIYNGASGFLAAEMHQLSIHEFIDKPGTMTTLGALAHLFGLTTHETFSPLILSGIAILYLVLLAIGHLWLRLPAWAAAGLAILGSISPAAWMLQTHTFLGNALALPLFALVLMLVRSLPTWRTSAYLGLILAAEIVFFPDGFLALAGMLVVVTPFLLWQAWRRGVLLRLALGSLLALAIVGAVIAPFRGGLLYTIFARFRQVSAAPAVFEGGATGLVAKARALIKPLASIDYTWPALNLNYIPPRPLQPSEKPYLVALGLFFLLFLAGSLWRNSRMRQLAWYLVGFLLLFAGGCLGGFQSDYELFRALAVFAFVPLAAVCALPWALFPGQSSPRTVFWGRTVTGLLVLPLLVHFVRIDCHHFSFANAQHAADAQYDRANLRDRDALGRFEPGVPMILAPDPASFTAFARVIMLLSNRPLAITPAFNKFVFFSREAERPGAPDPFRSPLVLHNRDYVDIFVRAPELAARYSSAAFAVTPNDLDLFPDSDTFPYLHGYPAKFVRDLNLPVRRLLKEKTTLTFFAPEARTVSLVVQFDPLNPPAELPYSFDAGPVRQAPAQDKVFFKLADFPVAAGVHTVTLGPLPAVGWVEAIRTYTEAVADPAAPLRGGWRTYATLTPAEQNRFRNLSPRPVRFRCDFDPVDNDGFLFTHPETRLVFRAEPGRRHAAAVLRLPSGAYENLQPGEATDGVTIEIACLYPDGQRAVAFSRHIDPARVPADRGDASIEADFELPPGAEIELLVSPGPDGRSNRDWCSLGSVTIR